MAKYTNSTDPVGDVVDELVAGMVTGWVLFVYFIDAETGDTCYLGDSMEGQGPVTTLGLLEACAAIERARIVRHHFDDVD